MAKDNISEKQKAVEKNLRENSKLAIAKLFENFKTSFEGISIVYVLSLSLLVWGL